MQEGILGGFLQLSATISDVIRDKNVIIKL